MWLESWLGAVGMVVGAVVATGGLPAVLLGIGAGLNGVVTAVFSVNAELLGVRVQPAFSFLRACGGSVS